MNERVKKYRDESPADILVMREKYGLGRYRKMAKRESEKREILLKLALRRMEEKEQDDFIEVGYRRRKLLLGTSQLR